MTRAQEMRHAPNDTFQHPPNYINPNSLARDLCHQCNAGSLDDRIMIRSDTPAADKLILKNYLILISADIQYLTRCPNQISVSPSIRSKGGHWHKDPRNREYMRG